jgi:short-subunit dehydrogenase
MTGCSSGIGRELLTIFNRSPFKIVVTTLPEPFAELKRDSIAESERIWIRRLDLVDYPKASLIVAKRTDKWGAVDIIINNAGISSRSVVEDMTVDDEQTQMQINYFWPMHLIRDWIPAMRERRSGRIINISSAGGMMAMPTMASYSASKFALEGANESLWHELKPWNYKVTLVRLGCINSLAFHKVFY